MKADVVVVGAGAAGLAAARVLAQQSFDVVVVEARDRVGGRILSVPAPDGSPPMELGAEFIHGPAEETRALLARSGGVALETDGDSWTSDGGEALAKSDTDISAAAALLAGARDLPKDESVARYLERFADDDTKRAAIEHARIFAEGFDAADPAIASAWSIADEILSGVDFSSAWPSAGYAPILAQLTTACTSAGARIHLSTVVRAARWRRGHIEIETTNALGERDVVTARAAILTLPVGVLRANAGEEIAFVPELPARTREALAFLEMGHVVKVVLRFATPFWETIGDGRYRGAGFFHDGGGPFAVFWTQASVHSNLVVAWIGGSDAKRLQDATSAKRIELALDQFGTMLGDVATARTAFAAGATHDWMTDPFARGAYSYVLIGGAAARRTLAESIEQTLFFAGEATSVDGQGGTVNGAIRTGERAAREALRALTEKGDSR
ncbi:MAG TPA: NAD(P)/FAD-dependent oxidoreductase [Candidatus Baltobacteraceae bacterium]